MTTPYDDHAALEAAIVSIADGHPRARGGSVQRSVWVPLLIEAVRILLPILIERCRDRGGRELRVTARAIRGRRWWNFGLHGLYNDAWYAARDALRRAGADFDADDVDALADRTIEEAASADEAKIEACRRAVLRA